MLDCDIEIERINDEESRSSIARVSAEAGRALSEQGFAGAAWDPKGDRAKLDYVVKFAVESGHMDPAGIANFVLGLSRQAQQRHGRYSPLDAAYIYLKEYEHHREIR